MLRSRVVKETHAYLWTRHCSYGKDVASKKVYMELMVCEQGIYDPVLMLDPEAPCDLQVHG
jgi:hypothetical protein